MLDISTTAWLGALLTGLLSTPHCLGMCGGLVAAYTLNMPQQTSPVWSHLSYSVGRIGVYTAIGALSGWVGTIVDLGARQVGQSGIVQLVLGITMALLGLNIIGWLRVPTFTFFRQQTVFPALMVKISRLPTGWRTLPLGVLTGFLPCALHWAMQSQAAASGSAFAGALLLFAFGCGTVPGLVIFGVATKWMTLRVRQRLLSMAGIVIFLLALRTLWIGLSLFMGHDLPDPHMHHSHL